ncbi:tRNA-splicing ligase [Powellomyces hirtus]|nr:tRNA-splicing ligase [Powellomyces hirtus]
MSPDTVFVDGTVVVISENAAPLPLVDSKSTVPTAAIRYLHSSTPVDPDAIRQLHRSAALPGMLACIGMPDLHQGSGAFPVGAAFLSTTIRPDLVGSDIGCGMALFPLDAISAHSLTDRHLLKLSKLLAAHGFPPDATIPTPQAMQHPLANPHARLFGTIGGGNHFAELQVIHELRDPTCPEFAMTDRAYVLVHSGSRSFGKEVIEKYKSDNDLTSYMDLHDAAVTWARENRNAIAHRFAQICTPSPTPVTISPILDITHNSVVPISPSDYPSSTSTSATPLYLHRKGAAPMSPPTTASDLIAIPGSRGTFTYIVRPTLNPTIREHCGWSVAHGAGRALSRTKVTSLLQKRYPKRTEAVETLARTQFNGYVVYDKGQVDVLYEEAPEAYKDIETVIQDLVDVSAVSVVAVMKPLITCKI